MIMKNYTWRAILFDWKVVLTIGVIGFILFAINNDACIIAGLVCIGYVALVVVVLTIFALFINPFRQRKK